jgi:glycosyltransferase involved in cell wall biosynthesis
MQFSIIIPARNEQAHIGRCLDSLLNLDWVRNEYEIIVVDNGSEDMTVHIARERNAKVYVKPGLTVAALRNFGADAASGEILAFLDADCTVHENWLRNAAVYLNSTDVACFGSPPVAPHDSTWVQRAWFQVRRKKTQGDSEWLESMNMFVRRYTFLAAGGFNEELATCEDYDLSLRLKRIGGLFADERIVAVHHGEATTIRQFFRKEIWRGTGNLHGVKSHGISWKELPSIAFPVIYGVFALSAAVLTAAALLTADADLIRTSLLVSLAWQIPLLCLAVRKTGNMLPRLQAMQLYVLLNVYFFARGCSLLQRNAR